MHWTLVIWKIQNCIHESIYRFIYIVWSVGRMYIPLCPSKIHKKWGLLNNVNKIHWPPWCHVNKFIFDVDTNVGKFCQEPALKPLYIYDTSKDCSSKQSPSKHRVGQFKEVFLWFLLGVEHTPSKRSRRHLSSSSGVYFRYRSCCFPSSKWAWWRVKKDW